MTLQDRAERREPPERRGAACSSSLKPSVFLLPVANLSSRCQHQQKICVKPTLTATAVTSIYRSASEESLIFRSIACLFSAVPFLHLPVRIWPGPSVNKHTWSKIIAFLAFRLILPGLLENGKIANEHVITFRLDLRKFFSGGVGRGWAKYYLVQSDSDKQNLHSY